MCQSRICASWPPGSAEFMHTYAWT
jgi:hypothetical protein